jgi:GT2 family glycosyltransferase
MFVNNNLKLILIYKDLMLLNKLILKDRIVIKNMNITASIVIYNEKKETLEKVIESFFAIKYNKELIIVDNSPKNELKFFCESFTHVKYIFNGGNIGFGAGHNLAFKNKSKESDIHIILNPDIYFDGSDISDFLKSFYEEKEISLATTKVCYPEGKVQNIVRNIPSSLDLIKRKLKLSSGEINVENNAISEIPFAHGCFLVFKTGIFEEIGGFDERFFMYMEDIDIFIRAKKYGKTVIDTNFLIYHEYRKGSSKSFTLLKYHIMSAINFFYKYKNINLNKFNKIN